MRAPHQQPLRQAQVARLSRRGQLSSVHSFRLAFEPFALAELEQAPHARALGREGTRGLAVAAHERRVGAGKE